MSGAGLRFHPEGPYNGLMAFLLSVGLLCGALFSAPAFAGEKPPIGKIISLQQKEFNPIEIQGGPSGHRAACKDCPVYEDDAITTHRSQQITLSLNDGTELAIGPDSKVSLENWSHRDADGYLKRLVRITSGALRATVKRVYSEEEPFLVKAKDSIMGVRGTQFVALLTREKTNKFAYETTVNLYTLEGEVHFARAESDLQNGNYVTALAGHYSVLSQGLAQPTTPRQFKLPELQKTLNKALPQVSSHLQVQRHTYQAKEESIRSVIAPTRPSTPKHQHSQQADLSGATGDGIPQGFPKRAPHANARTGLESSALRAATAEAERVKAHRLGKERVDIVESDDELMAQRREQEKRTEDHDRFEAREDKGPLVRPGFGPGPNGLNTFRPSNPTSPQRAQQGQPRPQAAPELRRPLRR